MTVSECKNFFRSIRTEQFEILHLKALIRDTEDGLLPHAIRYDLDKVQVSPEEKFGSICAQISEYQIELGKSIAILYRKRLQAERMIKQLESESEREILRWYYLTLENGNLLTWEQVGNRMNYSERQIRRLHGEALAHLVSKDVRQCPQEK